MQPMQVHFQTNSKNFKLKYHGRYNIKNQRSFTTGRNGN